MSKPIRDEKELGRAIKAKQDEITIEGDLMRMVIKIRATGDLAWAVAFAALVVVILAVLAAAPTGGTSGLVAAPAAGGAIAFLGAAATTSAVSIAVAAGSPGSLTELRRYKQVSKDATSITLRR